MTTPSTTLCSETPDSPLTSPLSFDARALAYQWPDGLGRMAMGTAWQLPLHLEMLTLALMDVAAGRTKRLLVTMPPQHGKSTATSMVFPPWYLGRFPKKRVILASYESDFAALWGGRAMDIMLRYGEEVFGVSVSPRIRSGKQWEIAKHGGGMVATGVGGSITGKGADLFIVEDPYKNDRDANSTAIREHIWDWYRSTAFTRLQPGGSIIVIQTRWHQDDLAGKLLQLSEDGVEDWKLLSFPAVAEDHDVLGRKPGEALWPERYDLATLREKEKVIGPYWWGALYQQRPAPQEGALFRRPFRYFYQDRSGYFFLLNADGSTVRHRIEDCWFFSTCDLASSMETGADYFCCCVWAVTPDSDLLLVEVTREHMEGPDQLAHLVNLNQRFRITKHCIEKVQYQFTLVQYALRKGLAAVGVPVHRKKEVRAQGPAARMSEGKLCLRRNAEYLPVVEDELLHFPRGKHDDVVDNFSIADETLRGTNSEAGIARLIRMDTRPRCRAGVDPRAE